MEEQKFGLLPKEEDKRDFTVGMFFDLPNVSQLYSDYELNVPSSWILSQVSDTCAGHASSLASSLQEGMRLDPKFTWVMAREMEGKQSNDFGISLRPMMAAHTKIGALELKDSPFEETDERFRDITNWDVSELLKKSVYHKKGSYISLERINGMDWYDTIRASIQKTNCYVVLGVKWAYGTEADISTWKDGGTGHAITAIGWKRNPERLIIVNSWGQNVGDKGKFYLSREIINKEVATYGAMIFVDETPEKLKEYITKGVKIDSYQLQNIVNTFIMKAVALLVQFYKLKNYFTGTPETSKYDWSTRKAARHSVRVIGDEEGLKWAEKDLICACIQQESNFDNTAVCNNKNKKGIVTSSDWGIVQCNDYWWIGKGKQFPSVEYVVGHPDEMVRWMIKMYKKGNLKYWVSYSSGAYKKYL